MNLLRIALLLAVPLANAFGTFTFYASETGIIRQFDTETGTGAVVLWNDPSRKWNAAAWDAVKEILYTSDMNTGQIYAFTTTVSGGVGYLNAPVAIYNYAIALGLDLQAARSGEFYNGSFFFTGFQGTQANLYQLQLGASGLGVTSAGQIATLASTTGTAVGNTMQSGDFVLNGTQLYFVSNGGSKTYYRYDIAGRIGSFGTTTNLNAVLQTAQPAIGFNAMTQGPGGYFVYASSNDTYSSFNPVSGTVITAITTGQGLGAGDATLFTNTPFQAVPEPSSALLMAAGLLVCPRWKKWLG